VTQANWYIRHARLAGADVTSDAPHMTAGHPEGQTRGIRLALADAGLAAGDIDLVMARATATPHGDLTEARAITEAIGNHPAVTAAKAMTGHLFGAAGALGALVAVLAPREQAVPPTINLDNQDPRIDPS
jgi:3-oxoacyl-[acyl-carrier-protein] synthase II